MTTIHLITPITTKGLRNLDEIEHLASSSLNFTHTLIDRGPPSIESEYDEALSVPDTIVQLAGSLHTPPAGLDQTMVPARLLPPAGVSARSRSYAALCLSYDGLPFSW